MGVTYVELLAKVPASLAEFDSNVSWYLGAMPALSKLSVTPQDPIYHAEGDVWTHTLMVCRALISQPEYGVLSLQDKFVTFYAALLHDIAKPLCTVVDSVTGRVSSAGHSKKGAIDARIILWDAGVPFGIRERICGIIMVHQVPFFLMNDRQRSPEYTLRLLSVAVPVRLLLMVALADMQGRETVTQAACLDDLALVWLLAEEMGVLDTPAAFVDNTTRWRYFAGNGDIYPETPFYREAGSEVIVLSGLPAVGKNHWVDRLGKDWPVLSFDDAKAEFGLAEGDKVGQAVHAVIDRAKKLLAKREPFIWNATHLTKQMRGKTLDLVHAYQGVSRLVYLEEPRAVLLSRNSKRDSALPNKRLEEMLLKWDVPQLPEAYRVEHYVSGVLQ